MNLQKYFAHTLLAATVGLLSAAHAQTAVQDGPDQHSSHHTAPVNALPQIKAEVRRIDTQANKITLKHGEITNLDMPPMTMVFQAATPELLQGLEVGQQVLFTTDKIKGAYTVLSIERAP